MTDTKDVVIDGATNTADWIGTNSALKAMKTFVQLVGREMTAHLRPDDKPSFFVPALFEIDGKKLSGAVLTLEDRAVFAWTVGTFRVKNFEAVVPYASIKLVNVEEASSPGRLVVRTDERIWTLVVPNDYDGGRDIVPMLHAALTGAVSVTQA